MDLCNLLGRGLQRTSVRVGRVRRGGLSVGDVIPSRPDVACQPDRARVDHDGMVLAGAALRMRPVCALAVVKAQLPSFRAMDHNAQEPAGMRPSGSGPVGRRGESVARERACGPHPSSPQRSSVELAKGHLLQSSPQANAYRANPGEGTHKRQCARVPIREASNPCEPIRVLRPFMRMIRNEKFSLRIFVAFNSMCFSFWASPRLLYCSRAAFPVKSISQTFKHGCCLSLGTCRPIQHCVANTSQGDCVVDYILETVTTGSDLTIEMQQSYGRNDRVCVKYTAKGPREDSFGCTLSGRR